MFVVSSWCGLTLHVDNSGPVASYSQGRFSMGHPESSLTLAELREAIALIEEYEREHPPENEDTSWEECSG